MPALVLDTIACAHPGLATRQPGILPGAKQATPPTDLLDRLDGDLPAPQCGRQHHVDLQLGERELLVLLQGVLRLSVRIFATTLLAPPLIRQEATNGSGRVSSSSSIASRSSCCRARTSRTSASSMAFSRGDVAPATIRKSLPRSARAGGWNR